MKFFYTLGVLILSLSCYSQIPTINSTYGVTGECTGVVYGNGVYVASANLTTDLAAVFTSADAKTWTPLPSGHFPTQGFNLLAFGNGVFVGVAFPATIYSSTDGANWTLVSSNIPGLISDLKFIQGAFYAIVSGATILLVGGALGTEIFRSAKTGTRLPQTNLSINRRETYDR